MNTINLNETLKECLEKFNGAPKEKDYNARISALEEKFVLLAKKLLYGGYLMVGNDYRIDISIVEFYYHEEKNMGIEPRIQDTIVYHRNGRYPGDPVPPFQTMSLHAHTSGYDITFEDPKGRYRASALIREYTVKNCHTDKYIKWDPKENEDGYYVESSDKIYDDRSQNLYYFLNGFELNGNGNEIRWVPFENVSYDAEPIYRGHRKNVFMLNEDGSKKIENEEIKLDKRQWAFSKRENTIVTHSHAKTEKYNKFSKKERYGITQGEFI